MNHQDIFSYIKTEESNFEKDTITIGDNWEWNLRNHVQLIFHLKHGMFFTGDNDYLRSFKAVMDPILQLSYWTEDIDLKDILFYIEGSKNDKLLSFAIKKYHDGVYVKKHNVDDLIDKITESDLDYGGVLLQKGTEPEVIRLNSIAFCDQANILSGIVGLKFNYGLGKLKDFEKIGWGKESNGATITLKDLAILASAEKSPTGVETEKKDKTTSKNVEVYVLRGIMPEAWLLDNDNFEDEYDQVQIVAFYKDKNNERQGVTLYRKKDNGENLKFFTSQEVFQRGLGYGVGERLIHPQVWTNFLEINKMSLLEAGSKVPLYTDDPDYSQKNKIQDMENLEITTIGENKRIFQVPTSTPTNVQLFSNAINEWFEQSQLVGSAFDPIIGKQSPSGTTFRGQERNVAQGRGIHDRRLGQRAKFIEEIYRDWIIPDIIKEISNGKKFVAELSIEEMKWIVDELIDIESKKRIKDTILAGGEVNEEDLQALEQLIRDSFNKDGNRKLLEILKDELKDAEIKIGINVANKQKDIAGLSDKLLSIFQFVYSNPNAFELAMQNPSLSKAFEDILEYSGMSIANFNSFLEGAKKMQSMANPSTPNTQETAPQPLQIQQAEQPQ